MTIKRVDFIKEVNFSQTRPDQFLPSPVTTLPDFYIFDQKIFKVTFGNLVYQI